MQKHTTADTAFQRVEVWKSDRQVEFRVAGAIHAWWHQDKFLTGLAWDNIAASCLLRPAGPPRSVLMLGLAGGTSFRALRHLLPDVALTAVDIDPGIVALAREHMGLGDLSATVHLADALDWLAGNQQRFDVVIDDIYLAGKTDVFRPRHWDDHYLGLLKRAVAPGGLLAANLVTGPGHRAVQSHARRVLKDTFPVVRSITTPASLNETLVAGESVLPGSALGAWTSHWPQASDRKFWGKLRVRKL